MPLGPLKHTHGGASSSDGKIKGTGKVARMVINPADVVTGTQTQGQKSSWKRKKMVDDGVVEMMRKELLLLDKLRPPKGDRMQFPPLPPLHDSDDEACEDDDSDGDGVAKRRWRWFDHSRSQMENKIGQSRSRISAAVYSCIILSYFLHAIVIMMHAHVNMCVNVRHMCACDIYIYIYIYI